MFCLRSCFIRAIGLLLMLLMNSDDFVCAIHVKCHHIMDTYFDCTYLSRGMSNSFDAQRLCNM